MEPFATRQLNEVGHVDLQELIDRQIPESLNLDYKRELNIDAPNTREAKDARLEFIRDICAFANSDGGLIVYGIEEDRDSENKPNGLPKAVVGFAINNSDALKLKLINLIRDGIDERLFGRVDLHVVSVGQERSVLVVRIPPSLRRPHMVAFAGDRGFYHRTNTSREPMNTVQIRDAVLQSQTAIDSARILVHQRIVAINNSIDTRRFLSIHFVPLNRRPYAVDLTSQETVKQIKAIPLNEMDEIVYSLEGLCR